MFSRYIRLSIWLVYLMLVGCSNEDPTPFLPAVIYANRSVIEINDSWLLSCKGDSAGRARYEWKFSNGTIEKTRDVNISFSTPGIYKAHLTVYNKNKVSDTASVSVRVGRRMLKEVHINKLDFLDPSGRPWDSDGTGPDVYFHIGQQGSRSRNVTGPVSPDVLPAQLPLIYDMRSSNFQMETVGDWQCTIWDKGPSPLLDKNMVYLYNISFVGEADAQGNSSVSLNSRNDKFNVVLFYEIR